MPPTPSPQTRRSPAFPMSTLLTPALLPPAILVAGLAALPVLPPFTVHLLALVLTYGTWAMSFGLVLGQLGLTTFGHAALFGGGAYAAAYTALNLSDALLAGLAAGALFGTALGAILGLVLGRLSGVAFAIGTLAFGGMVTQIANGWTAVTGGSDGLVGLPFPTLAARDLDDHALYAAALLLATLTAAALQSLLRHRPGIILHAVRDNPLRAESSGIPVHRVRILTLAASGTLAGTAGALSAYIVGSVAPSSVDWSASGAVLVMAVLGGAATITGPLFGAAAYTLLEQVLSQLLPNYRLVLGFVFIAIVLLAPKGVGVRRAP